MSITLDQLVIFAARSGNLELLRERVTSGGNINYIDAKHGSALVEAIRCNKKHVLDYLIENGVDVNVEYEHGIGPLEVALRHPNPEIVYCLVCAGARLRKKSRPYYQERLEECIAKVSVDVKSVQ